MRRFKFSIPINLVVTTVLTALLYSAKADWAIVEKANPEGPGEALDVLQGGKPVARLVHGKGQIKPYLHVFGAEGELLTNPGLDKDGNGAGLFNHHRGIFIGWNKISSELGNYDMWHRGGPGRGRYDIVEFHNYTDKTSGTIVAHVKWRATQKDANGSDVMIDERRSFKVSRPGGSYTQVDARFELRPVRDVGLNGDLHHAGIHFRAHTSVANRKKETSYLWAPRNEPGKGKIVDKNHKWARLYFPIGKRWYTVQQMNVPGSPVKELSWRDYGRFGYFFSRRLKKDEKLELKFRFSIEEAEAPAAAPQQSEEQKNASRKACDKRYNAFLKSLD